MAPTPSLTVHHLQVGQGERIPWLLEELSIPYTLRLYQRSPFFSPPELQAKHPLGASPLLEDSTFDPENPLLLAESGAIIDYIIHKHGNGKLALPPSHRNYADYLYWFHFSNSTLQPAIFRRMLAGRLTNADESNLGFQGTVERLDRALRHVDERLRDNEWLAGGEFTAADVMTVFCLTTMRKFEPISLEGYEGILGWLGRVSKREGYRRAMGRADPELDIKEGVSAEGPPVFGALARRK